MKEVCSPFKYNMWVTDLVDMQSISKYNKKDSSFMMFRDLCLETLINP